MTYFGFDHHKRWTQAVAMDKEGKVVREGRVLNDSASLTGGGQVLYLAGRSHGSSSRSGIGWCDLPWDLASNSLEDIVDDIGDRKMFFQRRWAGRYIVMGTTRQTPCRFSGPALRYGEPVGKQASIQEARPDPRFRFSMTVAPRL